MNILIEQVHSSEVPSLRVTVTYDDKIQYEGVIVITKPKKEVWHSQSGENP